MLAYTLRKTMDQLATIERNMTIQDPYGAPEQSNWETLSISPCLLSWAKSEGGRSVNRTYVSANREVPVSDGTLLMPAGTDVNTNDRIGRVTNEDGSHDIEGLMDISSVVNQKTHLEVGVVRSNLGG